LAAVIFDIKKSTILQTLCVCVSVCYKKSISYFNKDKFLR